MNASKPLPTVPTELAGFASTNSTFKFLVEYVLPANKLFPEEGGSSTFIGAGLGKVRFGSAGFFSSATATSVEDAAEAEADDAEALDPDLSEAEDALVPGEFASSALVTETFPPEEFAGLLAQEEMQEAMRKENLYWRK